MHWVLVKAGYLFAVSQVVAESSEVAVVWKPPGVDTHRADYAPTTDRAGPPVLYAARRAWGGHVVVCSDLEKSAAGLVRGRDS
jgi:hypothetical protein